jgi:uncharacterized protein (DUF1786 family)
MQILLVDVGTGTQDIYLFRSGVALENGFKLVMPSPTMMIRGQIQDATKDQSPLLLTGVMMGGGPCQWAAEDHLKAGLPLFATPEAARTFNDDLEWVSKEMGVKVISQDEAKSLPDPTITIEMKDFDYDAIRQAFEIFDLKLAPAAVAVAVFDHGAAPPDVSDRQFRFDYLEARIREQNRLSAFAYHAHQIPDIMTRMQAVANSAHNIDSPLIVMDTAPAAIIGATLDPYVVSKDRTIVANVGNFHTLAFRLGPGGIEGVFEHHTGLIETESLDSLLIALAEGSLTHEDVFGDHGHGALIFDPNPQTLNEGPYGVAVTGPRRLMMRESRLRPYFAVPFGDMMIAGCFGLLVAVADLVPEFEDPIRAAIDGTSANITPWDAE